MRLFSITVTGHILYSHHSLSMESCMWSWYHCHLSRAMSHIIVSEIVAWLCEIRQIIREKWTDAWSVSGWFLPFGSRLERSACRPWRVIRLRGSSHHSSEPQHITPDAGLLTGALVVWVCQLCPMVRRHHWHSLSLNERSLRRTYPAVSAVRCDMHSTRELLWGGVFGFWRWYQTLFADFLHGKYSPRIWISESGECVYGAMSG